LANRVHAIIDVFEIVRAVHVITAENIFPDGVETMEVMEDIKVDEEVVGGCAVGGENWDRAEMFRKVVRWNG
jgi:hypothetical protein